MGIFYICNCHTSLYFTINLEAQKSEISCAGVCVMFPKVFLHFNTMSENRTWPTETASWHSVASFQRKVTTRRQTWHFLYTKIGDVPGYVYMKCILQDTGRHCGIKKWIQNQKRCLTEVLLLIKARMAQDPYVKSNCIVLEKQIPLYNNGPAIALFDCLAALDGSATNTQSFIHEPLSS